MKTVSETESFLRIQLLREQIETLKVERALKLKEAGFKYDKTILTPYRNPAYQNQGYATALLMAQHSHLVFDERTQSWVPSFGYVPLKNDEKPPPMSFSEPDIITGSTCSCTTCTNKRSW